MKDELCYTPDMRTELVPPDLMYPDSDGQPMADNTLQFRWIVTIKENLDAIIPDFVAGDLLWYPVEGAPRVRIAPDVLVAFGRPKGERGSYKQWEEDDVAPQVVREILSPRNHRPEMNRKRRFYERHKVEEYYVYDPKRERLSGWLYQKGHLVSVSSMQHFVSPRLNIRFELSDTLHLYKPDGTEFLTFAECNDLRMEAEVEAKLARAQTEQAEAQVRDAKVKVQTAKAEAQIAKAEVQTAKAEAEDAKAMNEIMTAKLLAMGIDPKSLQTKPS